LSAISLLHAALEENEQWFDELRFQYDEALQQIADLQDRNDEGRTEECERRITELEADLEAATHRIADMTTASMMAQTAIHELQSALTAAEAQLSATVDDLSTLIAEHGADLAAARQQVFERDSTALLQAEQLRLETDKVGKLEGELKTTPLILASQDGQVASLKDKIGQMRFEMNEKMFVAGAEVSGLKKEIEAKDLEIEELSEELRAGRDEQDRSDRERGEVRLTIHSC
jgi:chromosome segregation ATPase